MSSGSSICHPRREGKLALTPVIDAQAVGRQGGGEGNRGAREEALQVH